MRPLTKFSEPYVLVQHGDDWTRAYVLATASGTAEDRRNAEKWRHKEIKETLHQETAGKCAYCEALIGDVSYPQVEHIIPKSIHPELAHRWHNLTWACGKCNGGKSAFYDAAEGIFNPYVDRDLIERLVFHGDFVDASLGDVRGEVTIRLCDLNRFDLVKSRVSRLKAVRDLIARWHESEGALKYALEAAIRLDCAQGEFTASVTAFLARHEFPVDAPEPASGEAAS